MKPDHEEYEDLGYSLAPKCLFALAAIQNVGFTDQTGLRLMLGMERTDFEELISYLESKGVIKSYDDGLEVAEGGIKIIRSLGLFDFDFGDPGEFLISSTQHYRRKKGKRRSFYLPKKVDI